MLAVASLTVSLWQVPVAAGALNVLTLVVTPTSTQTPYGSNPSNITVDVNFLSTDANDEYLKLSANMVSFPAGQNPQATIAQVSSANATLEMFDSSSHIKAVNPGVVNAKFAVSIKSATSAPLAVGTYSLLVFAGSTGGSQQQSVTFVISPPPTPTLSSSLSRIWMAPGATSASESNNTSSISVPAKSDLKTQVANLTVDLRDSNNSQINYLPITVTITGPGLLGIGSSSPSNFGMGRAVVGQPGQYAISIFPDGLFGVSTISIFQSGQIIGSRNISFTQAAPEPASISISKVSVDKYSVSTGESVRVMFVTTTTSLPTGQTPVVSITSAEDCADDSCLIPGLTSLVSGDSSNGTWSGTFQVSKSAISGTYSIQIYFPKLKGTPGFIYTHPQQIVVKGVAAAPPAPPASASLSILSFNKKILAIGESLVVKIGVKTSNFPAGVPIQASIFTPNDCQDVSCSSWGTGNLISGTLESGVWEVTVPINSQMLSGKYSINYGFFKLKGTSGAIETISDFLDVQGIAAPPAPLPTTISISNIKPSSTSLNVGSLLEIQFDLASSNLGANETVQVYLADDSSGNCNDGCGLGLAKLIKGSVANGSWIAQFTIPNTVPTGNYNLVVALPKRKGASGAYAVYSQTIYVTGAPRFTPVYLFSSIKTSATSVRVGQTVSSSFYLKTNDDRVSTPECIIDGLVGWTAAKLVEGSTMSGSWFCNLVIPSNAVSGTYKLQAAVVGYANGDKNEEWVDLGSLIVSGTTLVQTATSQQCLNYLNIFSSTWSTINSGYNELKVSLSDPKFSQPYFIGKFRNWNELYSEKLSTLNSYLFDTERMLALASSNETVSCDFYDFSKSLSAKYTGVFTQTLDSIKSLNSELSIWYKQMQTSIPDPVKYFNPAVETGTIEVQKVSESVLGRVNIAFAYQSSSGVAKVICNSNFGACTVIQNSAGALGSSFFGSAEITNVPSGALVNFTLIQYSSTGKQVASSQQTYTSLRPGLQPLLGPITSVAGGCTFKILNYDPAFTWFAKSEMKVAKDGTATINSNSSLVTDEYISTSRVGYQTVNAINTLFKCVPLNSTSSSTGTNTSAGNTTPVAPVITVEDEGAEELPSGTLKVKKETGGRYLLAISSNLSEEKVTLTASRKGKVSIRFSATTNEDGAVQIRTSRNLSGYSVKLVFDGEVLKTVKVA